MGRGVWRRGLHTRAPTRGATHAHGCAACLCVFHSAHAPARCPTWMKSTGALSLVRGLMELGAVGPLNTFTGSCGAARSTQCRLAAGGAAGSRRHGGTAARLSSTGRVARSAGYTVRAAVRATHPLPPRTHTTRLMPAQARAKSHATRARAGQGTHARAHHERVPHEHKARHVAAALGAHARGHARAAAHAQQHPARHAARKGRRRRGVQRLLKDAQPALLLARAVVAHSEVACGGTACVQG